MPDDPRSAPAEPGPLPAEAGSAPEPLSERHHRALERFVVLWGEMATHWGINRTMAQLHALLYASERPLDTDEIMERLDISRGNANMNLRALADWDLVRKVNLPGSRKDYYVAEKDVWKISSTIIEERHRREIKPVEDALADTIQALKDDAGTAPLSGEEKRFLERMDHLHAFMRVFDEVTEALLPFLHERNAGKVRTLTGLATRLGSRPPDASDA
jgi:DNA-binding transcriptional regulator GbsR (MarR family)